VNQQNNVVKQAVAGLHQGTKHKNQLVIVMY